MENLKPLILDSLELLILGMGTVFIILTMLIFLISLVSKLFVGYDDEPAPAIARKPVAASDTQDHLVAVIGAAISAYKKKHQ